MAPITASSDVGSRPVPDPTVLTTAQLLLAISTLRELMETRIDGLEQTHIEKFRRLDTQIAERDTRTEQTSRDSKVAVDAAFAAAKEAVGEQNKSNALSIAKSEAAFTKQIDQIGGLISTIQEGLNGKIDDVKTRLTTIETSKTVQTQGLSSMGTVVLGILVGLSALASIIAVVMASIPHH